MDEAPTTTMHSQNVRISSADGRRYNILADKAQTIVLALKNINSKAERDAADAAEAEDRREDWVPLFEPYLKFRSHVGNPIEYF